MANTFPIPGKNPRPPEVARTPPLVSRAAPEKVHRIPSVEVDHRSGTVSVLETVIPMRSDLTSPLVPRREQFRHFTLDRRTVEVLERIATAVELSEPCLLEGETSTSKTSSIEYLAMLTGTPVVRLNLNGQTDTSELIGKYVPNDQVLTTSFEQLLKDEALLSRESRAIVHRAHSESRGLTLVESQRIAANEHIDAPEWRWKNGIIPEAMIHGWWVILDELNLAEPQILERLNPVLERLPSIVLSENGGLKIGPGGTSETHPGFRIFGTMNSAEYSGRQPLSPAYKDRWTTFVAVQPPTAEQYKEMLYLQVYGEQPDFASRGIIYHGTKDAPALRKLGEIEGMRPFLADLSKAHEAIEKLGQTRAIGKSRKEKYVFTRRCLLELLDFMEQKVLVNRRTEGRTTIETDPTAIVLRALEHYYLGKVIDTADRKKVQDQLDAAGLTEGILSHRLKPRPKPVPVAPSTNPSGTPKMVQGLSGAFHIEISPDVEELGKFKCKDFLRLKPGIPGRFEPAVEAATSIEVVGISWGAKKKLVLRIDGNGCIVVSQKKAEDNFEQVPPPRSTTSPAAGGAPSKAGGEHPISEASPTTRAAFVAGPMGPEEWVEEEADTDEEEEEFEPNDVRFPPEGRGSTEREEPLPWDSFEGEMDALRGKL